MDTYSGGFRGGGALGAEAPPLQNVLICISPWPIAYVATYIEMKNENNVYLLFGDADLAQQTIPHSSASNILFLIYAHLFYLMHHNV